MSYTEDGFIFIGDVTVDLATDAWDGIKDIAMDLVREAIDALSGDHIAYMGDISSVLGTCFLNNSSETAALIVALGNLAGGGSVSDANEAFYSLMNNSTSLQTLMEQASNNFDSFIVAVSVEGGASGLSGSITSGLAINLDSDNPYTHAFVSGGGSIGGNAASVEASLLFGVGVDEPKNMYGPSFFGTFEVPTGPTGTAVGTISVTPPLFSGDSFTSFNWLLPELTQFTVSQGVEGGADIDYSIGGDYSFKIGEAGEPEMRRSRYAIAPIRGTFGGELITGRNGRDVIFGGGGDDTIYGRDGGDIISGDEGNDIIDGGRGNDQITGAIGNDKISGGSGNDVIYGGDGEDTIRGDDGDDEISGDDGNDIIYGGDGEDAIEGNEGEDRLDGGPGADRLDGGGGNDRLDGGRGNDFLLGGDGNDILFGIDNADTLWGNAGDDDIWGGSGNDIIYGGDGVDRISGDGGDDYIDGGTENDLLWGSPGNDIIYGQDGDDHIYGDGDNDQLSGGFGNDQIIGGGGDDTITGGQGDDIIYGDDDDHIYGDGGNDQLSGGFGNDQIIGGGGDDTITGGQGDDTIAGGDGNDLIDGGPGSDFYAGGPGFDTAEYPLSLSFYDVSTDGTTLFIEKKASGDIDRIIVDVENFIFSDTPISYSGLIEYIEELSNAEGKEITGTDQNDRIEGTSGNDIIRGEKGGDKIFGYEGDDIIYPGKAEFVRDGKKIILISNDIVVGGDGYDILVFPKKSSDGGVKFFV